MHQITNLWKFELNWSSKLRDNNGRRNTLVTRNCVLSDAWFRIQSPGKLLLSPKVCYFRGSLFLTMFYTINSSPLLVINEVFMLTTILSNYQQCPVPLIQLTFFSQPWVFDKKQQQADDRPLANEVTLSKNCPLYCWPIQKTWSQSRLASVLCIVQGGGVY